MKKSEDNLDMHILKTSSCKTITGKSTLTYQIGATPDNAVHIRITKNTGAGFFNDEWIKVEDIKKALADGPEGQPLTSFLLAPLFTGRSVNSPAFVLAALMNERLLRVLKGKKRGHEFLDLEGFNTRMDKLVASKAKTEGTTGSTVKKAPRKKATIKKKAMPRLKTAKTD